MLATAGFAEKLSFHAYSIVRLRANWVSLCDFAASGGQ
jgi:hypothetical protein